MLLLSNFLTSFVFITLGCINQSLNSSRENILLNLESKLNKEEIKNYNKLIKRRKNKEPVSQIEGKKFFWK